MVVGKGRGRIAPKQGKVEYGEKGIVDTSRTRVHQFLDLISINRMLVDLHDADGVLHPRNFLLSGKSHRRRRTVPGLCAVARSDMGYNLVDVRGPAMETIEAQLILDPQQDEDPRGQTDGQPKNVQATVKPAFPQTSPGSLEIVSEHGGLFKLLKIGYICRTLILIDPLFRSQTFHRVGQRRPDGA